MLKDKDIRKSLFDFLENTYGRIRIIEEKVMGNSRADIVMITNDCLIGIEIKSDADTYARLNSQIKDYDRFYDRNIVVVGSTHGLHIKEHVPSHWGIITVEEVDGEQDFYLLRKPDKNPYVKFKDKLKLLWRPELYMIQEKYGMAKYKDKSKDFVIEKICSLMPDIILEDDLNVFISYILFERDYSKVSDTLTEYRKGELQKSIEKETDPQKKLALSIEQAQKRASFALKNKRRKRRHRIL